MSSELLDWLPLWAQLLLMAAGVLMALLFLLMPFAVFGVKGRLAEIELQLEEARGDLRVIATRLATLTPETGKTDRSFLPPREQEREWAPPVQDSRAQATVNRPEFQPTTPQQEYTPAPHSLRDEATFHFPRADTMPDITPSRDEIQSTSPRVPPAPDSTGAPAPLFSPNDTRSDTRATAFPPPPGPDRSRPADLPGRNLRVPHVTDAYEPRHDMPDDLPRMPWHTPSNPRKPEPPRPDKTPTEPARTEPTLRWPPRPAP